VQRDHKKPVRFNREAYSEYAFQANFVDAGVVTATLLSRSVLALSTLGEAL